MGRTARRWRDRLTLLLGTGAGTGWCPVIPGTIGSLWGPVLVWWLRHPAVPLWATVGAGLLLIIVGIPICGNGSRLLRSKDPAPIVYDEIVAFIVVLAVVPLNLTTMTLGFVWFRLFDILKPWPAHRLERLPGGWGIVADDLAAAIYAAAALWLTVSIPGFT